MAFRFSLASLALAALLAVAAPASAQQQNQDLRSLLDRIERLQRDVDVLQRQLARGGAPAPAPAAAAPAPVSGGGAFSPDFIGRTEDRFGSLEDQVRTLTGRIEELTHRVTEASARLDKLVTDIDFRLNALERGGAAQQQGDTAPIAAAPNAAAAAAASNTGDNAAQARLLLTPGARTPAAPTIQLPAGPPEAQYEFAYGMLTSAQRGQTEFSRAEQAFRAFLAANPSHRLAGNAQYWLGETFYAQRDFQSAAALFAEGVQKFPRSEKAPDSLVKLGITLGQLNRKPEACGTLAEVEKRYPSANAAIKRLATNERARLACT